jgi:O-antigen ligase
MERPAAKGSRADRRVGDGLSVRGKVAGALGIGFGLVAAVATPGLALWACLCGFAAVAGGLASGAGRFLRRVRVGFTGDAMAWIALALFFGWLAVTTRWTPAPELGFETLRRLGIMIAFLPFAAWAAASFQPRDQATARRAIVAGVVLSLIVLSIEGANVVPPISSMAKPHDAPLTWAGDLGRSACATLTLVWVAHAALWLNGTGRNALIALCLAAGYVSLQFGTDLNAVAFGLSILAALIALKAPRFMILGVTTLAGCVMAGAPVAYPWLIEAVSRVAPDAELPLSYARRVQMWEVAVDLIRQKPWTGWGLGAASTFDAPIRYGGLDWTQLQRHPHAAPLHIWVETGAVGAGLAAAMILGAGFAADRAFRRDPVAAAALIGGLTHVGLNWAVSHSAWREWLWVSFATLIAFSLALRTPREDRVGRTRDALGRRRAPSAP